MASFNPFPILPKTPIQLFFSVGSPCRALHNQSSLVLLLYLPPLPFYKDSNACVNSGRLSTSTWKYTPPLPSINCQGFFIILRFFVFFTFGNTLAVIYSFERILPLANPGTIFVPVLFRARASSLDLCTCLLSVFGLRTLPRLPPSILSSRPLLW